MARSDNHPGLVPARLPDVAGVGPENTDPSPTPHGAQRGARHLPAIVNVAQSAERPPCKGQVARSTRAVGSGLCGCEFIEPYNSAELSASAEHHGGTPIRPWRIGTARNEERAKRLVTAGRDRRSGPTGFDVEQRTHLTAPAGAHTAVITLGNDQSPTTTSPLFRLRPESVDTRGARVAYRRHHTSWTGAIRRRPVEIQTVVEAPTPRRQGPLRALRAATRVSEGVFWSFADPGSIPGGSTSQKQWAKGRVMPARRELITRGKLGVYEGPPRAACPRGGRTPALGRSGSRPPRTSGVMRSVEVHVMRDGVQRRDCRESAATFHMEASELAGNWSDRQ